MTPPVTKHRVVFDSLAGYQRSWLRPDIIAGLTVWAVLIPESLAYASIAGVSPVVGLYAAPPALLLYAAFGSSRHLIVGPMSATAALSAAAVADLVADPDDVLAFTAALALATGFFALAAGLLRLGFLSNFISEPVLKGFIIGMALTIIIGQVPKLLGIEKEGSSFFEQLWHIVADLGDTDLLTLAVGLASLAIVLVLRRLAPAVPGSLVAVGFGIVAVTVFDLAAEGVDIVGSISSGLPSLGPPDGLGLDDYLSTAASAAGIMLVGFAEGLGAAKTYAAREHYEVDANRELIGLGAANLASGLSSGMVVNGSLSKTAVNGGAGAKSQVSGLVVAVLAVLTLLFLTALFEDLPEATLAAVVIAAVIELVDIPALRQLHRTYSTDLGRIYGHAARPDFIAAVAALLGVLLFDTLPGLFIGIATSLVLLLYRTSIPNVAELGALAHDGGRFVDLARNPESTPVPGVVVLRVEGGMFFANAEAIKRAVRADVGDGITLVVLDAETVPYVDVTAVRMLAELADDLARDGVHLAVARGVGQVRDVVRATDDVDIHLFPTAREAIAALHHPGDAQPGVIADELVDLVDEDDRVIEVVTRAEMRARGATVRHRSCYVAVLTSGDELVVHRRADWKEVFPGYWDVCFGGVLGAGEAWADAARRELAEEAGIDADLVELGRTSWSAVDTNLNARVYLARSDGPFTCPDGEVVEVATVPLDELDVWLSDRDVCTDSVDIVVPMLAVNRPGRS